MSRFTGRDTAKWIHMLSTISLVTFGLCSSFGCSQGRQRYQGQPLVQHTLPLFATGRLLWMKGSDQAM